MTRQADQNNSSRPANWKYEQPTGTPVNAHKILATGKGVNQSDHPSLMTEHVEPKPR